MQVKWLSSGFENAIGVYKPYPLYTTGYDIQKKNSNRNNNNNNHTIIIIIIIIIIIVWKYFW